MVFLNLFFLLQVFNFDDFRYPQSVVITDFSDIFGTSEHQYCTALPFVTSLTSLSNSCALTLPLQFLHTLSPHDPILTKHQAFAPSGPMLLILTCRMFRVEFCFNAAARAWQETNHLRNTMMKTAHTNTHTHLPKLQNVFTAACVFQIGQHHHLLARKHSFSGLLVFEL